MQRDRFILEDRLWVVTNPVGVAVYDFDFRQFFDCRTPYDVGLDPLPGVARIGAFADYPALYSEGNAFGIELVHTPEEHLRCTTLSAWYPLIENLTPRSRIYATIPSFAEIENDFELPIFVKGARQTSKHQAAASIVHSRDDFNTATTIFESDPILRWQEFVCRELVELRPVQGGTSGKIPASYEFRTFWWRGELVGAGRYWYEADDYAWTVSERLAALKIAAQAVDALQCTFLVVDLAQTPAGDWLVIECNDGMESGYAGASPFAIWQNIIEIESHS